MRRVPSFKNRRKIDSYRMNKLLSVRNLSVSFRSGRDTVYAVNDLSFELSSRETLCIIGESGCGKTVTCRAILYLNKGAQTGGEILFDGQNILRLNEYELQRIRGGRISMVFQNPASSLNPLVKIGAQMVEVILYHQHIDKTQAKNTAVGLLKEMGIPSPMEKLNQYPHQQSDGTSQRIMIAIALSCNPDILIADEPTASLDVTVQNQVLRILENLKEKRNLGIIFVTHNLGLVYEIADRILIVYYGMLMEEGTTKEIFENPLHPYTKALLSSIPLYGKRKIVLSGEPHSPSILPKGCPYAPRCQELIGNICLDRVPESIGDKHKVRCHRYDKENIEFGE